MLVHRLSNGSDRRVVERAAGDRSAAVPSLAPGQALLLGIDYPIPLVIKISPLEAEPTSCGAEYQKLWSRQAGEEVVQDSTQSSGPAGQEKMSLRERASRRPAFQLEISRSLRAAIS